jgi:hypothetical protein
MTQYGVVLFHTNSAVMRAEKLLMKQKLPIKLIPTPREFSSDCGIALRFEWLQRERIERVLADAKVEIAAIHLMRND